MRFLTRIWKMLHEIIVPFSAFCIWCYDAQSMSYVADVCNQASEPYTDIIRKLNFFHLFFSKIFNLFACSLQPAERTHFRIIFASYDRWWTSSNWIESFFFLFLSPFIPNSILFLQPRSYFTEWIFLHSFLHISSTEMAHFEAEKMNIMCIWKQLTKWCNKNAE